MTTTKYITINTASDAWGDTTATPEFDVMAEVSKIRDAAESAGVEVFINVIDQQPKYDDNDNERVEIDWFDTWCSYGYEWTGEQWSEWFLTVI